MIRGKIHNCPFGLPVTGGCSFIGGTTEDGSPVIARMTPVDSANSEQEAEDITEYNLEAMMTVSESAACPFADRIYEKKGSVDCKYDERSESMPAGNVGLTGSPLYPHTMVGNMPQAQYGYPLDHYSDDNESRNIYYGIYSLIG